MTLILRWSLIAIAVSNATHSYFKYSVYLQDSVDLQNYLSRYQGKWGKLFLFTKTIICCLRKDSTQYFFLFFYIYPLRICPHIIFSQKRFSPFLTLFLTTAVHTCTIPSGSLMFSSNGSHCKHSELVAFKVVFNTKKASAGLGIAI